MDNEKQLLESNVPKERSDDEAVYRKFAPQMAAQITLNNKSDSVEDLIDALKKSKYYETI